MEDSHSKSSSSPSEFDLPTSSTVDIELEIRNQSENLTKSFNSKSKFITSPCPDSNNNSQCNFSESNPYPKPNSNPHLNSTHSNMNIHPLLESQTNIRDCISKTNLKKTKSSEIKNSCFSASLKLICYLGLFTSGILVGYIFSYVTPMFTNQNKIPGNNGQTSPNEECIPPLTKTKFHEFGVELALGENKLMQRKEKWVLRDEHQDKTMDYRVYTHTIDDFNYAICGYFKFQNIRPQVLSDTYFVRKLQEKWDYIGHITTLESGAPKNLNNLPYNGSRANPEMLYVQSALPIIQDTDKVLTRGTEMFRDPKTDKILIVSVSRDVGPGTHKIVPFKDDFTRTYSLDVAVVISTSDDPNTSEFFAYIRESTTFTVPEFVIANVVPMTIPEYFSNFYKIAQQVIRKEVQDDEKSSKDFFDNKYMSDYTNIRDWRPAVLNNRLDPDEEKYNNCNTEVKKSKTAEIAANVDEEPVEEASSAFAGFFGAIGSFVDSIDSSSVYNKNENSTSTIKLQQFEGEKELLFKIEE